MYVFTAFGPAAAERSTSSLAARICAILARVGLSGPSESWQDRQYFWTKGCQKFSYVSDEPVGQVLPVESPSPSPQAVTSAAASMMATPVAELIFERDDSDWFMVLGARPTPNTWCAPSKCTDRGAQKDNNPRSGSC